MRKAPPPFCAAWAGKAEEVPEPDGVAGHREDEADPGTPTLFGQMRSPSGGSIGLRTGNLNRSQEWEGPAAPVRSVAHGVGTGCAGPFPVTLAGKPGAGAGAGTGGSAPKGRERIAGGEREARTPGIDRRIEMRPEGAPENPLVREGYLRRCSTFSVAPSGLAIHFPPVSGGSRCALAPGYAPARPSGACSRWQTGTSINDQRNTQPTNNSQQTTRRAARERRPSVELRECAD